MVPAELEDEEHLSLTIRVKENPQFLIQKALNKYQTSNTQNAVYLQYS